MAEDNRLVTRGDDGKLRELTSEEQSNIIYLPEDILFRKLSPEEEKNFILWAQEHFSSDTPPNPLWHPVVRREWARLQQCFEELVKGGYPGGKRFVE